MGIYGDFGLFLFYMQEKIYRKTYGSKKNIKIDKSLFISFRDIEF